MSLHHLFTTPFDHYTDFTELADHCERFCEVLVEESDPLVIAALCGRLNACLTLLKPTLTDPVPPHLVGYLTVDSEPVTYPEFNPETDQLCRYCEVFTQLLLGGGLSESSARVMTDLLYDLTGYFAERLKFPRWIRTQEGVAFIE
ncbi:hypothetical protein V1599_16380 [Enterobacter sp. ECC-175]|uniref:hypothetical protein n=1 Tax=Enterobacter sp. ECC-175 TaxID=3116479 RepID=UPI0037551412